MKRFQYILDRLPSTFLLRPISISFSFISTTSCALKDRPDTKWFGVHTVKSSVSLPKDIKNRLLIVPSMWKRLMINWYSRIGRLFVTDFNVFFVTFTNNSLAPTIHRLLGGMKCHWIIQIDKLLVIALWSKYFSKNVTLDLLQQNFDRYRSTCF